MRRFVSLSMALSTVLALAPAATADLFSKSYEFKPSVTLELGISIDDGLRLDTVRFQLPSTSGTRFLRTGGLVKAEVAVSNAAEVPRKAGIAVALFDEEGRMVGVAGGGTKLMAIKPGRQKSFTLVFDGVNGEAYRATTFQISLESKP